MKDEKETSAQGLSPPKLRICMVLNYPRYGADMRVPPQIGICSYLTNFGHEVAWVIPSE